MKNARLVYYLDDDVDDLEFFKDAIESIGHSVSLFSSGHELLAALQIRKEKPENYLP